MIWVLEHSLTKRVAWDGIPTGAQGQRPFHVESAVLVTSPWLKYMHEKSVATRNKLSLLSALRVSGRRVILTGNLKRRLFWQKVIRKWGHLTWSFILLYIFNSFRFSFILAANRHSKGGNLRIRIEEQSETRGDWISDAQQRRILPSLSLRTRFWGEEV